MTEEYTLLPNRLKLIVEQWESAVIDINNKNNSGNNSHSTSNNTRSQLDYLFCVFGDMTTNTLENQRGASMLQFMFNTKVALANTAVLLSRHSALFIHDEHVKLKIEEDVNDFTVSFLRLTSEQTASGAESKTSELLETLKRSFTSHISASGAALTSHTSSSSETSSHNESKKNVYIGAALKELEIQEGVFAPLIIQTLRRFTTEISESEEEALPMSVKLIESAPFIGSLLFVKDDLAISSMEKAAGLCSAVFRRYARPVIEEEMVKASPKTLIVLKEELCERLTHPNTVHGLESLTADEFAIAAGLTPCVFCQSCYVASIQVNDHELQEKLTQPLRGDVIIVRYGVKHFGHTAFIARTLLVQSNAPSNAQSCYSFVYKVSEKVIQELVPGKLLSEVYSSVMSYANELDADLASHLPKSLGFSTGLLVLESRATISPKGSTRVADNMCFVLRITLENVESSKDTATTTTTDDDNTNVDIANDKDEVKNDNESKTFFSIELADTVIIRNGVAELKTKLARKVEDILYEDAGEPEVVEPVKRDLTKITRQGQSDTVIVSREAQRDDELRKLLRELHAEFLANGGKKGAQVTTEEYRYYDIGRLSFGELNPFKSSAASATSNASASSSITEQTQQAPFHISTEKKIVWLPVGESLSMFHVSTINKVDVQRQGDRFVMTMIFHSLQEANIGYKLNRTKVFLKELNYASPRDVFSELQAAIQACQQRIKNDDAARKREANSASFGKLQILPNALRLPQVKMRPPVMVGRQSKSCVGNLELHHNGLRFTFLGGAPVDMPFDNIKHVIFQPAVNSIAVIYHITLKKSIELGRKACQEIQFVAEVMESSEAASGARRSFEEEVMAEQRDEMRVKETNKQFITFARAVEERSKITTQLPTSKFAFDGVHTRAMTTFRGSREVLWAISDWPAFTQRVEEIEVVSFERVVPGGSTIDMTLILKDYSKPVITINSIARTSLEVLKDWCLAAKLYYMETTVNPNWKVAMKDIREDEDWDPWLPGAGWSVLNNEHNEEDEGGSGEDEDDEDEDSESDSTYYEEEDEETDSDDSSWLEDDEGESESDNDSNNNNNSDDDNDESDSSDASWDELERKALEHDRKRNYSDDDNATDKHHRRHHHDDDDDDDDHYSHQQPRQRLSNRNGNVQERVGRSGQRGVGNQKRTRDEDDYSSRRGSTANNSVSSSSAHPAIAPAAMNRKTPMSMAYGRSTIPPPASSTMRRF